MYEKELIQQCRIILDEAEKAHERGDSENFAVHISNLYNHLTEQLAGKMPTESSTAEPEQPSVTEQENKQVYHFGRRSDLQTACGLAIAICVITDNPDGVTCKTCQEVMQGGPEQPIAEATQQGEKAKSDAAARRKAGNSPY